MVNATPDVHHQIESAPELHPSAAPRHTPLRQILLTDAELDHTLGLMILREGTPLEVYATDVVLAALGKAFPARKILRRYAPIHWHAIRPGKTFSLDGGRLRVRPFRLGSKRPRYAANSAGGDWVIGYRFEDVKTQGVAVYAPGIESWTPELARALDGAGCAFVDGTFWSDDELKRAGVGRLTARQMGHLPIDGRGGTLERLAKLPIKWKIYVHVNNTNPMLDARSPRIRRLAERGVRVGRDGLKLEV